MSIDIAKLSGEDYWRALCPGVPLSDRPFDAPAAPYQVEEASLTAAQASLRSDGYGALPTIMDSDECAQISRVIQTVTAAGLPAPFAFVYDPIWRVLQRLAPIMSRFLGPNVRIAPDDLWVWQVDGVHEARGWSWHRDRPSATGFFDAAGQPSVLSVWLPFTAATADNGCIEVLPQGCDPSEPRHAPIYALPAGCEPLVRKLPAAAGAPLLWNVHLLHRGGAYRAATPSPRISAGIYLQSAECETFEGRDIGFDSELPLLDRLGAIAQVIGTFRTMYPFAPDLLAACEAWHNLRRFTLRTAGRS